MTKLKTIKVQGGAEYVMVKERVAEFNRLYPEGGITTEIIKNDSESVVMKATVYPDPKNELRRFVGHSEAFAGAKGVEGQKPVEVCETSAIGRALAAMGIGVLESYASADEVSTASRFGRHADTISAHPITAKQKEFIMSLCLDKGVKTTEEEINAMDGWQASKKIEALKKLPVKSKSKAEASSELDFVEDLDSDLDIPIIDVP